MWGRWLETVLVSDVVHAVCLTVWSDIRVWSTDGNWWGLSVWHLLQLSGFFGGLLIGLTVSVNCMKMGQNISSACKQRIFRNLWAHSRSYTNKNKKKNTEIHLSCVDINDPHNDKLHTTTTKYIVHVIQTLTRICIDRCQCCRSPTMWFGRPCRQLARVQRRWQPKRRRKQSRISCWFLVVRLCRCWTREHNWMMLIQKLLASFIPFDRWSSMDVSCAKMNVMRHVGTPLLRSLAIQIVG